MKYGHCISSAIERVEYMISRNYGMVINKNKVFSKEIWIILACITPSHSPNSRSLTRICAELVLQTSKNCCLSTAAPKPCLSSNCFNASTFPLFKILSSSVVQTPVSSGSSIPRVNYGQKGEGNYPYIYESISKF